MKKDAVVKIDADIMKEVEKAVEANRFKFSSKKQLVTLSIVEFLKLNSLINNKKNSKRRQK